MYDRLEVDTIKVKYRKMKWNETHIIYITLINSNSGCGIWTFATSLILTNDIFQILDFNGCTVECGNNHYLGSWKIACQNW